MTLQSVFVFVVGLVFGSFYNVLIYRIPEGRSIISPPSSCPNCGTRIRVMDNIPLLSYLLLRGRCRYCGGKISPRYPAVELLTGLMFLFSFSEAGISLQFVRDIVFYSILLVVSFIDYDHRIIPDVFSLGGTVAGLLLEGWLLRRSLWFSLWGALAGGGLLFLTAFLYQVLRKQEGLGMGDVKLLLCIGAFTGVRGALFSIFAGSLVGALVGLGLMWKEGGDLKTAVPFGPFLAIGAVLADLLGASVLGWIRF